MLVQYIGYIGSLLVAISLSMSNIRNLRIINLVGASTFATYGFFINSYPVLLLNSYIVLTDIYYLYQIFHKKDYFNINDTLQPNDYFVGKFLSYYNIEIESFFPNFSLHKISAPIIILISRNLRPVGMFIYEEKENGIIQIHLDFAIPDYRDTKNVRYIFMTKAQELRDKGFHTFQTISYVPKHQKYLKKVGFKEETPNVFVKQI